MTEGQAEQKIVKQTIVCNTLYWLLLQKELKSGNKRSKLQIDPAIKVARNILRKKLEKPSFNLRREFVIRSLSYDARFILPPTCGKGHQTVQLTKSLEMFAPSNVTVDGRRATYFELLSMLFELETSKMDQEIQDEVMCYLAAA